MTAPTSTASAACVGGVPVWPRRLAIGSVLVVAATVFALSFVAISEVAVAVGAVNAGMGWLVPIAIDGGIIAGCATLWAQALEARRSWRSSLFVAVLLGLSVWVNVEHTDGALLARVIAGSPPVILFGALELVADQFLRTARTHGAGQVAVTGVTEPVTAVTPAVTGETEPVTAVTPPVTGVTDEAPVDPSELIETSARLKVTERARQTLDAYVAAGGDSSDSGLAQAIAARIGCHPRTAYRVIQDHLDRSSATASSNGSADARADPQRVRS